MKRKTSVIESALEAYTNRSLLLKDIAAKHGVTEPAIVYWVKKFGKDRGIELRGPGCRPRTVPSVRDRRILRRASEVPYEIVAKEFSTSRQRVGRIVTIWRERGWIEPLQFKVGDTVRWSNQFGVPMYFIVLRIGHKGDDPNNPDLTCGAVREYGENGNVLDPFFWTYRGHKTEKIPERLARVAEQRNNRWRSARIESEPTQRHKERLERVLNFRVSTSAGQQIEALMDEIPHAKSVDQAARSILMDALAERWMQHRLRSFDVDKT